METPIIIFGAQSKGQVASEIFRCNGILVYGFLDDDQALVEAHTTYGHVSVLGTTKEPSLLKLLGEKCHPFIALEHPKEALSLVTTLGQQEKLHPLNAVHPATNISKEARIGAGNIIHAGTSIGSDTLMHSHCALMGHNMVAHGVTLHDFVQLAPGAIINPNVTIHEGAYIGSGAIIQQGITIGKYAHVAPGSLVLQDVPENTLVAGNPARALEKINTKSTTP